MQVTSETAAREREREREREGERETERDRERETESAISPLRFRSQVLQSKMRPWGLCTLPKLITSIKVGTN